MTFPNRKKDSMIARVDCRKGAFLPNVRTSTNTAARRRIFGIVEIHISK
jgi:hypothetical protein